MSSLFGFVQLSFLCMIIGLLTNALPDVTKILSEAVLCLWSIAGEKSPHYFLFIMFSKSDYVFLVRINLI